MVDSIFDDGPISDAFSPEPVAVSVEQHLLSRVFIFF